MRLATYQIRIRKDPYFFSCHLLHNKKKKMLSNSCRKREWDSVQSMMGALIITIASGELIFNIFGTLEQFERGLIQERTQVGMTAARARGGKGGRPEISNYRLTQGRKAVLINKELNKTHIYQP